MNEFNETLPLGDFDREFTLKELLATIKTENLLSAITSILDEDFCLKSDNEEILMGQPLNGVVKSVALKPELEPIGYLVAKESVDVKLLKSVSQLIEIILKSSVRYLMASDLHLETVQSDYEDLKKNHQALMESESRYKDLATNLEQRVAEQVKTIDHSQRQLYQAEKLASVGQLAAGVAHEINNPLGFIHSNLSTSKDYVTDFTIFSEKLKNENDGAVLRETWDKLNLDYTIEDFHELLNESIDGAQRVSKIISDLKEFSSVDQSKEVIVDINDYIRSACNIAQIEIDKKAQLVQKLAELPKIKCQSGQLSQVFLNILLNAEQIIDDNGEIIVKSFMSDDGKIVIEITDNGPGISSDVLKRVFDPFYTTKEVGEGTGLGLTVSRDIILSHNGIIEIDSEINQGTTIRIILPVNT